MCIHSTDNWTHVSVERAELAERRQELEIEDGIFERDYRFFDRVQGTESGSIAVKMEWI